MDYSKYFIRYMMYETHQPKILHCFSTEIIRICLRDHFKFTEFIHEYAFLHEMTQDFIGNVQFKFLVKHFPVFRKKKTLSTLEFCHGFFKKNFHTELQEFHQKLKKIQIFKSNCRILYCEFRIVVPVARYRIAKL